jgi:sialate O-acetylesterase
VWERQGYGGLDGVGWYRTAFTLSPAEAAGPVTLRLGRIDDADATWVNGVEVGRTNGYDRARVYTLPPGVARAGRNVVAVRVEDGGGDGGIHGASETVHVETAAGRRPFPGPWRFRVGVAAFRADGQRINKVPTLVYNRMLHPLLGLPATGVLWYQGESNANDAAQATAYRAQFAALIAGWRREWGRELPFLWAQLPNFGDPDAEPPARPAWALLRESQAAALALPRTGQAVTIDVGEAGDIHPRNKQDVGRRLALVALRVVYGEDVAASGPAFRRATFGAGRAVVEFDHAGGGLVARGGEALGGFAVAGADGRFVWAEARVDGERVVVWSERVPEPVAVRYAWSNGPVGLALYNREGLPAAPFRTDDW